MSGFFTPLFLCQKLVFSIHALAVYLLRFIRSKIDGSGLLKKNEKKIIFLEPQKIEAAAELRDFDSDDSGEEIYLKFKFPTYQEFTGNTPGSEEEIYNDICGNTPAVSEEEIYNVNCTHEEPRMEFTEYVTEDQGAESNSTKSGSDSESLVSHGDGFFLSDGDFEGELNESSETGTELSDSEEDFSEDSDIIMEEDLPNNNDKKGNFLSDTDFNDEKSQIEKSGSKEHSPDEDENELESLWEHQELVEQLKMELKKVRATGLATILEDCESPKLMDDLKPWKIDEFKRGDCFGELHKFYRSYREKMRKFDIINYQKMYAMGFLQLKDPLKSISMERPSAPTLKSLVSRNLWLSKHKIHGTDPMKRLVQELQGDLEGVYVGQMCLSWEFLHWQYERTLDLWDSDRRGAYRRYNEVAGEFQQFQVLLQRFIEDEPFQGPRVQNYVKTRCAVRNLLQVPVIREDNLKDKKKAREKGDDDYTTITSDMLVETVEESIRIFWRFVRADKDCTTPTISGHKPALATPEDLKLLMEIKKNLQKKERKLKDLLRSENCILRKFRQCRDDDSDDQVLYFFSQVDMRLVGRVLNMSKVTNEQLVWCCNKLKRIGFVNRRIHVEPAFLLFPC